MIRACRGGRGLIAHGYAVTGKAMAAALHSNVGLFPPLAILNAWCDRRQSLILGATVPSIPPSVRPWSLDPPSSYHFL